MIDADKRQAIFLMHQQGMSIKDIVSRLSLSRNTVRTIIRHQGKPPETTRKHKITIAAELLTQLYQDCDGWIQRMHEKLVEEHGTAVKYSTLTRLLRTLGIGKTPRTRCHRVPDTPGAEFQHDTTVYHVLLGTTRTRLIASLLYLRYSKRRYLKFYRAFNRFKMKCFFHEALMHWGYAAQQCIIDNTNLARLRGTGKDAVIVPEMAAFARQYRFHFRCHEKGHANRKAGEERSFYTVETNFFPGRRFASLEDLNRQAFEWATVRMDNRPVAQTGLIPAQAFEHERSYLLKLAPYLPPPYRVHQRPTDQYGYIAFDGNYYWVPGSKRENTRVFEYSDRLKIYLTRKCVAEYPLPADGVHNQRFTPAGMPPPRHQPPNRKQPTQEEEKRLRAMAPMVNAYLDFALKGTGGIRRHHFVRQLFALSQRLTASVFLQTVERALRYRITSMPTIERIARLHMTGDVAILPDGDLDESFHQRQSYLEGSLSDAPDFSLYDQMLEENHG